MNIRLKKKIFKIVMRVVLEAVSCGGVELGCRDGGKGNVENEQNSNKKSITLMKDS